MIFLTGHRATGKSTVGKILQNQNNWFLDAGPFWRSLRDSYDPSMSAEAYVAMMTEQSNNPNWTNDFLAAQIIEQFNQKYKDKNDIVIGGYRSLTEIEYISSLLEGNIFPGTSRSILYISCPFPLALERYQKREGIKDGESTLRAYYQHELDLGLGETRASASHHIKNDAGLIELQNELDFFTRDRNIGIGSKERQ